MTRLARAVPIGLWLLVLALAALVVGHARYRADLSAFLPRTPSALQELLVQQLSRGPASQLMLIGIDGADPSARAAASRQLAATLRAESTFLSVQNGAAGSNQREQQFAFTHRYQLSETVTPARFSAAGLHTAIDASLALLASPAEPLTRELFQSDPTGETLQVIDQLSSGARPRSLEGVWSSADGQRALLIAQTRASGTDTDAQAAAIDAIHRAFAAARSTLHAPLRLQLTGPGVFSVQARGLIEHEALRLSLLSTALIMAVLLLAYRSVAALLFGLLPVLSGALAGIAAVALGFGVVEGVTLGFGITLIGESVDYPIYLFVQARGQRYGGVLWPTIGLGALTSICGFASLLPSDFPGLAQLGLYTIAGLTVAAAVTRWVLPALWPARLAIADLAGLGARLRLLCGRLWLPLPLALLLALLCVSMLFVHRQSLWNRDLAALSPLPPASLRLDAQLRASLGAPDVSNFVLIEAGDRQQALQIAERAAPRLDGLQASGVIGGYDSPARLLPSRSTQLRRLASLPEATELWRRLQVATQGLPVAPATFAPFVAQVAAARREGPIRWDVLQGTALGVALDSLLWQSGNAWDALLPLHPPARPGAGDIDMTRVRAALANVAPGALRVLNTRQQSDALYAGYLHAAVRLALLGLLAIVLLLVVALRGAERVLRVMAPLLLAVLAVSAGLVLLGVQLTLLHLIGLLLIVAVGSNYALFFDRSALHPAPAEFDRTLASLLVANASTVIGFGVLASSSVPVLNALGRTVAPGTLLALLFSALLAPRALYRTAPATARTTPAGAHEG